LKDSEVQFALNLEALSAPQCRRILQALVEKPLSSQELTKACKLSPASIGMHLEPLIRARLVAVTQVDGIEVLKFERPTLQPTIDWFADLIQ
jgi:DNA-binding transcriptional ArsR family regulator